MLTGTNARSFQTLTLALQKCNAKREPLLSTTRFAVEARAHMRLIKGKHCHGGKEIKVLPERRDLPSRRHAWKSLSILLYSHYMIKFKIISSKIQSTATSSIG